MSDKTWTIEHEIQFIRALGEHSEAGRKAGREHMLRSYLATLDTLPAREWTEDEKNRLRTYCQTCLDSAQDDAGASVSVKHG